MGRSADHNILCSPLVKIQEQIRAHGGKPKQGEAPARSARLQAAEGALQAVEPQANHRADYSEKPPSIGKATPVMKDASREQR